MLQQKRNQYPIDQKFSLKCFSRKDTVKQINLPEGVKNANLGPDPFSDPGPNPDPGPDPGPDPDPGTGPNPDTGTDPNPGPDSSKPCKAGTGVGVKCTNPRLLERSSKGCGADLIKAGFLKAGSSRKSS